MKRLLILLVLTLMPMLSMAQKLSLKSIKKEIRDIEDHLIFCHKKLVKTDTLTDSEDSKFVLYMDLYYDYKTGESKYVKISYDYITYKLVEYFYFKDRKVIYVSIKTDDKHIEIFYENFNKPVYYLDGVNDTPGIILQNLIQEQIKSELFLIDAAN